MKFNLISRWLPLGLLIISACKPVYTTEPIGERVHSLHPENWDGTWIHSEGSFEVKVIDEERGLLRVAWIDNAANTVESGLWLFASMKDREKREYYLWGRIKKRKDQIILWIPDTPKFARLVKEGLLPGTVQSNGEVILGQLTRDHLKTITSSKEGVLLAWESPVVLFRLAE